MMKLGRLLRHMRHEHYGEVETLRVDLRRTPEADLRHQHRVWHAGELEVDGRRIPYRPKHEHPASDLEG